MIRSSNFGLLPKAQDPSNYSYGLLCHAISLPKSPIPREIPESDKILEVSDLVKCWFVCNASNAGVTTIYEGEPVNSLQTEVKQL
jgi:hypothetical protein